MKKAPIIVVIAIFVAGLSYVLLRSNKPSHEDQPVVSQDPISQPQEPKAEQNPIAVESNSGVKEPQKRPEIKQENLSKSLDDLNIDDPVMRDKLLVAIATGELKGNELSDYLLSKGPKGYPHLGVLASKVRASDPDQANYIVHFLFNSLQNVQDQKQVTLVAGGLYNADATTFLDDLYQSIQNEPNYESRFKLFGALTGKQLNDADRKRFIDLALNDKSPEVQEIGKQWAKFIEGKQ